LCVALVLAGCGGGDTSIRPTVKRSGEGAEKQAAVEKAPAKNAEKQPGNGK
jgi:hypothetical protein